jgi:8-oxo-dGTP pyrophosphatase MutT (NUDIX family)
VTPEDLRKRLTAVIATPPEEAVVYGDEVLQALDAPPIPAAVLVPVVLGTPPGILLTKRNARLNKHAGQVSFPGGRIDPGETPEAAALREAEEEVGLAPRDVELLGRMSNYVTGTGYRITPVVGLLPPGLTLHPSPEEVDSVFELPIDVLLDPDAPQRQSHARHGNLREYWVWPHPDHYIWGATAAILVHLAQKLRK